MKPYVVVNCAMSADGKIALPSHSQVSISDEEDFKRVHRLRNTCDAVLVGVGTVLSDDPRLTVKSKYVEKPKNPVRIVLDSNGRTPERSNVLDGTARTIIVTREDCPKSFANAETLRCGKDEISLTKLMDILFEMDIKRILVEGGGTVIWSFLRERLVDELKIFVGSVIIGGKEAPTPADGEGARGLGELIPLKLVKAKRLGKGILLEYEVMS